MISIFVIILAMMIGLNYRIIEIEKRSPSHIKMAVGRVVLFAMNSLFLPWPEMGFFFACQILAFGLPFNIILNLLRRKPPLYLGKKPENSNEYSRLDNLAQSYPSVYWFVLFWSVGASIAIYINYVTFI